MISDRLHRSNPGTAEPRAPVHRQRQQQRPGALALLLALGVLAPATVQAGPLVRRAQERRACQEFARQLQASSGNPAQAQQIYQQGVLKLVAQFGENPCGDIPAPVAGGAPTTPATTAPAAAAPTTATPATTAPANPAAAAGTTAPAAASAEQQQACQEFARRLQAAQGNPAQAQQIYAMGSQRLSSRFGANPCPAIAQP